MFPEAENRVDDNVLVSNSFFAATHDRVTDGNVLEVATVDQLHAVDLNWWEDGR